MTSPGNSEWYDYSKRHGDLVVTHEKGKVRKVGRDHITKFVVLKFQLQPKLKFKFCP